MSQKLLTVDHLGIEIHGNSVVSDVSFAVDAGEFVAIVGETGAGKSMCARAIAGTLGRIGAQISHGTITLGDVELSSLPERQWSGIRGHRISLVPQASMQGLDPLWRIGSQLSETLRLLDGKKPQRARLIEQLEQVEIRNPDHVLRQYPHELSGGMRQRVMIALALAGQPELLVADEPTTALDVTVQRAILKLLQRLTSEGLGVLLITHDLGVVEAVSDNVVIMKQGFGVESGPTAQVLANPQHPYSRALLDSRPSFALASSTKNPTRTGVSHADS